MAQRVLEFLGFFLQNPQMPIFFLAKKLAKQKIFV
jgi:hypothetical protein